MSKEVILGLHGFSADSQRQMHDAGVCILIDGEVAAAVDEERLTRVKRDGSFPIRAFQTAIETSGISPNDIDAVAFVDRRSPWQTIQVWRYALDAFIRTGAQPWRYLAFWSRQMLEYRRIPPPEIANKARFFFDHHHCHAASTYYTGPYNTATVVTLDGMGDFSIGGSIYKADDGQMSLIRRSNGYFSPGHFYMIVTQCLGFLPGRDEGKITGLAAHGDPDRAYATMERVISYRHDSLDFVAGPVAREFFNALRNQNAYMVKNDLGFFKRLWDGFSREDIAAAAQKRFEDVIAVYVLDAIQQTQEHKLALAGGCFANVRLNQRLLELPEVEGLFVHPNMNDGGLATGAAFLFHHKRREKSRIRYMHRPWRHVYLGPDFDEQTIIEAAAVAKLEYRRPTNIAEDIAHALVAGQVIALFQGRMEYGPRALGNRSLLAAAVDPKMPALLNGRLCRTEFMPFAPIVLEEKAQRWFPRWNPTCIASRFMTITYEVENELRSKIPAVVHVDGTARPQIVGSQENHLLHTILKHYEALTGIPILINTSFNMRDEPIVCSPTDAILALSRGAADTLVMNNIWIDAAPAAHQSCCPKETNAK